MKALFFPSYHFKSCNLTFFNFKCYEWKFSFFSFTQGQAIDSEHLSEFTEEEIEVSFTQSRMRGFARWDYKFFIPLFTRRFTQQELKDCKSQMTDLTNQWYQAIRISPIESDEETTASTAQLSSLSNNDASGSSRGDERGKKSGNHHHGSVLSM